MRKPIIIIEKDENIPAEIIKWADSHSVPIIFKQQDSIHTKVAGSKSETENNGTDISDYDHVIEYSEDITEDYLETAYCHARGIPAAITSTERLLIREIGPEDLELYQKIIREYPGSVSDHTLLNLSFPEFKDRHLAYMKYSYSFLGYGIYGIFLKNEKENISNMIGIAGLDGTDIPSLSYALFKNYQGMGYAFEACKAIIEYSLDFLAINRINICVKKDNISSIGLARKLKTLYPDLLQIIEETP